jgi:CheY-like chemotaxis protein
VDDIADNREIYAAYLQWIGYAVAEAADGEDALAKVCEIHPDAALMDLSLPRIDGWEVTRRLRQNAATKREHTESAESSGCDAFLAKPCLPETVADELRRALAKSKTSFKLPE